MRRRVLEGEKLIAEHKYVTVIDAVRDELELGKFYSALTKVKYHQKHQPRDPQGYYLEGEILAQLERWKDAYIAFNKGYYLTKSAAFKKRMEDMKKASKKGSLDLPKIESGESLALKEEIPEASEPEEEKVERTRGSFLALSRMRMVQSLLNRYESQYGKMETFDAKSLLKDKVTTREVNLEQLGELSLEDGVLKSSKYGTIEEIETDLKKMQDAIKADRDGESEKALEVVQAISKPNREEMDFKIILLEKLGRSKEAWQAREELVEKFNPPSSFVWHVAQHYYKLGDNKKAKKYLQKVIDANSPYKSSAKEQLAILNRGGTSRLRQLLDKQREEAFSSPGGSE